MSDSTPTLITGGAGYIGSHAVLAFQEAGRPVVVLDDLSTGRRGRVPAEVPFAPGDAGDAALVGEVIRSYGIANLVHFAGSIVVPESLADPLKYYRNNTCVGRALIDVKGRSNSAAKHLLRLHGASVKWLT
jgi:UDP-glucose 4-epimerase